MRKKVITTSFLAMSLSIAAGVTTYAAGWVQDKNGWLYQYDNGSYAPCGWFTDPDTGAEYYIDPDGYMMTDTRVEGFRLGPDGRKREKTEKELAEEAKKKAEEEAKPRPSKIQESIDAAVADAKTSEMAVSTFRTHYQAEMRALMDKFYLEMANKLYADVEERQKEALEKAKEAAIAASMANEDGEETGDLTVDFSDLYPTNTLSANDNYGTKYSIYRKEDNKDIISTSYSKVIMKRSENYVPYALEITYDRSIANSEEELVIFDEGFRKLVVAALGENAGGALYDKVMTGTVENDNSGVTDTENTYVLTNENGNVKIQVTCSEKVKEENASEGEENTEENQDGQTADNTEQGSASSVITAGKKENKETAESQEAADGEANADNGETANNEGAVNSEETSNGEETTANETAATNETTAVNE